MAVDLGRVRTRMVDLEDHHEEDISVEGVMAKLLGFEDEIALGETAQSEVRRAVLLWRQVYLRMGAKPTETNLVAIGFLQGLTFAVAYAQIAEES